MEFWNKIIAWFIKIHSECLVNHQHGNRKSIFVNGSINGIEWYNDKPHKCIEVVKRIFVFFY